MTSTQLTQSPPLHLSHLMTLDQHSAIGLEGANNILDCEPLIGDVALNSPKIENVPACFQTTVLLVTLFTVSPGKSRMDISDRIVLRTFVDKILDGNCMIVADRFMGEVCPIFPSSFYNHQYTYLQMQNAFFRATDTLQKRVQLISACQDDSLIFKRYSTQQRIGCKHFLRACQLYCTRCNEFYFCKQCHDAIVKDHSMEFYSPSYSIPRVKCVFCGTISLRASSCAFCGHEFASYFCSECLLYCDAGQDMYPGGHCKICNICALYNQTLPETENTCPMHHDIAHNADRICIFCGASKSNDDISDRHFLLPCGTHSAHTKCYCKAISNHRYRCPSCNKLILYQIMRAEFELRMKELFEITRRPPPMASAVLASYFCYECESTFVDQPHVVPLRCWNPDCLSFNTTPTKDEMTSNMRRQIFETQKQLFRENRIALLDFNSGRALIRALHRFIERYSSNIRSQIGIDETTRLREQHVVAYLSSIDPSFSQKVTTKASLLEKLEHILEGEL